MQAPTVIFASGDVSPMFSLLALMLVGVVAVSLVLLHLRQSLLVAYFLCGVAIANSGLLTSIAGDQARETVATMSDYGVMLLLFVLGMEFTIGELKHLRRYAVFGGAWQMGSAWLWPGWRRGLFFIWVGRRRWWWRWLVR